jgi:hypothetical protein
MSQPDMPAERAFGPSPRLSRRTRLLGASLASAVFLGGGLLWLRYGGAVFEALADAAWGLCN